MIMKGRSESKELKVLRSLDARMVLPKENKRVLASSEKGYQGELRFDEWALPLQNKVVFLNDLMLEHQGSPFQIDSCAFASNTIFHFEVKNFEGDYRVKDNIWFDPAGIEIKDPLLQMNRAGSLIRQRAQKSGYNAKVESFLVFINPKFYLYNPPDDPSIVYFPQLSRFMNKIQNRSLKVGRDDIKLAEKLLSFHSETSPYSRLPAYSFEKLKKGIICPDCNGFYRSISGRTMVCRYCSRKEAAASAILRTIEEFRQLFPGEKVTTNKIYAMCGIIEDKRTIRKVLSTHFKMVGSRNHAFYVSKLQT
ncbi:nuclease-related domain-containing protein [Bacillus salacetis]|uniref:nuclease-related domain-containing protein n=1 Tax=Bacillus salacetis TaxID=2315464 RepID=UPI003BA238A1